MQTHEDAWLLRVIDLKQYEYCPRVVYYDYCLGGLRPTTYKMAAGITAQERVNALEERRGLRAYGVQSGERHYHVPVHSEKLGCSGQIDMVIETADENRPRLIPVDFKLSRREPGRHFKLQLACYALLLEEAWGKPGVHIKLGAKPAFRERVTCVFSGGNFARPFPECWFSRTAYPCPQIDMHPKPVEAGALYLIPTKEVVNVPITTRLRNDAIRQLLAIRQMVTAQQVPPPTPQRSRCVNCEFRRFCNDVV